MERDKKLLKHLRSKKIINIIFNSSDKIFSFKPKSFDSILCLDVLEHDIQILGSKKHFAVNYDKKFNKYKTESGEKLEGYDLGFSTGARVKGKILPQEIFFDGNPHGLIEGKLQRLKGSSGYNTDTLEIELFEPLQKAQILIMPILVYSDLADYDKILFRYNL